MTTSTERTKTENEPIKNSTFNRLLPVVYFLYNFFVVLQL